ncbi:MAG: hypothetical protein NZ533_03220 [Casimicrobiaceae bacterium]|nr:hypothetical protein [Casimicrobiaceae bacterium]MDW8313178.1 hypothetical protein [Burkholderiales bacterium]
MAAAAERLRVPVLEVVLVERRWCLGAERSVDFPVGLRREEVLAGLVFFDLLVAMRTLP